MAGSAYKPVVLVCGKTGAGKTSLIQAVTGTDVVPDSAIGESGRPETRGFSVYETEVATFVDAEGMEPGRETVDEYRKFLMGELVGRISSGATDAIVTAVWYCIDGSGARVQSADKELVSAFGDKTVLVVTKCETMRKSQFETMGKALASLMPDDRVIRVSSVTKAGLCKLVDRTHVLAVLNSPEAQKRTFEAEWNGYYASRQRRWRTTCDEEADSYIRWGAGRSFAIALPCVVPLSDMIPLSINEAYMIMRIGSVYGETVGKNVIGMITGVAAGSFFGKFVATMLPPGFKSVVAASVTYGLGKAAKAYFSSGKKLSKNALREEFLKAKKEGKSRKWKAIEAAEE